MLTRVYRRDRVKTPTIEEVEEHRVQICALLKDGYSVTAIVRRMNWGNDLPLRAWLKKNPDLDILREQNGFYMRNIGSSGNISQSRRRNDY